MRLYTEEQIKQAIELARVNSFGSDFMRWITNSESDIIDKLTPIELPSDEEIEEEAESISKGYKALGLYNEDYYEGFTEGVKWVINRIKQQDNGK